MPVRDRLKRLAGVDRLRVIAVIGTTREEVRECVEHAHTSPAPLPVWAWCHEEAEPVPGCERFVGGATAGRVRRDLSEVWPALCIVAWTGGRKGRMAKLIPFTVPPFRIVVCNEACGFFAARPGALAGHAVRRTRDAAQSAGRRATDWLRGGGQWLHSLAFRSGQRLRDGVMLLISLMARFSERVGDVLLALLAVAAKATPPLSRFATRKLGGGYPGDVAPKANGFGFSEIEVPGRGWPRRKVMETIEHSDADFIVLRRAEAHGDPQALTRLACDTGAFAVALQSAYTGWRPQALNKHPFRRLQVGEATRVFAPWSSMIAIRRDLLLEFGVPRAATYGSALMILYWKAASAGFKSLTIGSGGCVTQEPAMELEDLEFAARATLSGRLRGIGPAPSERPRGNVASSPGHMRGFRGRPRVLVVSPYLPFPLSHGGAVRIYNLCREMSAEIDFVLACFREAGETVRYEELHEVFREVHVVDIDEKHLDATVPTQVAEYRNTAMAALIRRLRVELRIDIVQLEYTQMAEYRAQAGDLPAILVEHDITFTLHRQLAETSGQPASRRQYELWRSFEREALCSSSAVWTMSDHDRDIAIENGAAPENTFVAPNGVDLRRFQPLPRGTEGPAVLFVGSFRHLPNLLAFEALRDSIMPAVWRDCPDAKLHVIAGLHHEKAAAAAGKSKLLVRDPRISIAGFVEDVRPAYRECDVVVIPLPVSAGTNIKLMEAMACGRAVVSTPVGCQGLGLRDGRDLAICELDGGFAEAVTSLLRNSSARMEMAEHAGRTAELRFGWGSIARECLAQYERLRQATYSFSER